MPDKAALKREALAEQPAVSSTEGTEIITAELTLKVQNRISGTNTPTDYTAELSRINQELERYTSNADKTDYSVALGCGILAGLLDSFFAGEFSLTEAHEWGGEQTERFVLKVAKWQGYQGDDTKGAIVYLAEKRKHPDGTHGFHLASDSNTPDFGGGKQHHLRDFAHHGTVTGLLFSMLTQFTGKSYGTDVTGRFIVVPVRNKDFIGRTVPQKLLYGTVYWFFHLVSDVAGSGTSSEGTGIPGPILSCAKLLSSTPLFKNGLNDKGNREFSTFLSKLFNGTYFGERDENGKLIPLRFDMRTEVGIARHVGKMTLPILLNEALVRAFYLIRRLVFEFQRTNVQSFADLKAIEWDKVKPYGNRTIGRMLTVSSLTFTVADTTDAAIHAALESGGNWVLFTGRFLTRFNYIGIGRAAIAVVREVSSERKETQLIREKRILIQSYSAQIMEQIQQFKKELDQKICEYLAEDIVSFLEGFDNIERGLASNDSDLVIQGNLVIQRVLGREPQFINQKEFDELIDSDIPLIL